MGHKSVCFTCRKARSLGTDPRSRTGNCGECGGRMEFIYHLFKPPGKNDEKAWKVVEFLVTNGFRYQRVYRSFIRGAGEGSIPYPDSMKEAKDFVVKYAEQARVHMPSE